LNDFYAREFRRFVMVLQYVGKLAMTALEYPSMQTPAPLNLQAIKEKIQEALWQREGEQYIGPSGPHLLHSPESKLAIER
jgi:hypothetical protein